VAAPAPQNIPVKKDVVQSAAPVKAAQSPVKVAAVTKVKEAPKQQQAPAPAKVEVVKKVDEKKTPAKQEA
jgi:hypothetical protein